MTALLRVPVSFFTRSLKRELEEKNKKYTKKFAYEKILSIFVY